MEALIIYPETKEQMAVLKAVAKALKVKTETEKSPYNPEFVKMIKMAEKRANFKTIDPNDVWGSLGLK
ncbi:DUF2683 family protein [Pedobacter jejuensis]|uniref:Uncharacterized protein n=1 Tax=Pedobacter jejuensis TaxID=1268550 RepID=A0A3N0C357_9SPHI|nr:DUF2683 family protein [Pedobacter jejuensis]RNL56935.1 hypothetical protein D7004_00545 [Pedobacter jejuensis]